MFSDYLSFQRMIIQYLPNTLPTPHPSSQLITLEAIPPNTPIFEISAIIHHAPNPSTTPITPSHHSDALSTHPLLRLALSPYAPNCILHPHLKLFLCSTELIAPYDPEPPPVPNQRLTRHPLRPSPSQITSYFQRTLPTFRSFPP